jgi:hypothetical protein
MFTHHNFKCFDNLWNYLLKFVMTTLCVCVCVCVCVDRVLTINMILFHHKFSSGNFFVHLYVYSCFEILWNHSLKFVISKLCVMWYSCCTSQFVFLCCLINFMLQTNFVSKMLVLRSSVANKIHRCHHAYNHLASGENKVNSLTIILMSWCWPQHDVELLQLTQVWDENNISRSNKGSSDSSHQTGSLKFR